MAESEEESAERVREERAAIVRRYDLGRDPDRAQIDDWEDPKLEIYHTQDRYGFIHDQRLPDRGRSEREQRQIKQEVARSLKWAEMLKEERKYFPPGAKYREKMINRVYKGVPDSVRGRVWHVLLDIERIKKEQQGTYVKMRRLARKFSPDIRQIDLDVNRTYRDHVMFRERYNHRQVALFHVLAAYSMYNSEVGYCQGMSQIAALLLMYLNEEEDVFWALSQLMVSKKYAMHGFFIQGFPKLLRFQAHHERVLKKFLPKLKKHLDKNGIDTGIYTLKWFFQCFLDRIPFSLTLRIWDLYLLEGERVMIGMAYNILRTHRRYLMKQGMDELIEFLQIQLEKDFGVDDDVAVDKLREVINELASNRLDWPGRPPPDELPQRPFGLLPELTAAEAAGTRTALTDRENEAIRRQRETLERQQSRGLNSSRGALGSTATGDDVDELSDQSLDETTSIPDAATPSALNHSVASAGERISSSSVPTTSLGVSRDPRAASAQSAPSANNIERLDDSVRMLLLQSADLNGGREDGDGVSDRSGDSGNGGRHRNRLNTTAPPAASVEKSQRYSSSSLVVSTSVTTTTTRRNNGDHRGGHHTAPFRQESRAVKTDRLKSSTSEQKMVITKGDVVRIHVPYTGDAGDEEVTVSTDERTRTKVDKRQSPR